MFIFDYGCAHTHIHMTPSCGHLGNKKFIDACDMYKSAPIERRLSCCLRTLVVFASASRSRE